MVLGEFVIVFDCGFENCGFERCFELVIWCYLVWFEIMVCCGFIDYRLLFDVGFKKLCSYLENYLLRVWSRRFLILVCFFFRDCICVLVLLDLVVSWLILVVMWFSCLVCFWMVVVIFCWLVFGGLMVVRMVW